MAIHHEGMKNFKKLGVYLKWVGSLKNGKITTLHPPCMMYVFKRFNDFLVTISIAKSDENMF